MVGFSDCDFAGVLFYGKIFELVHKVYEEYLESQNYYKDYFRNSEIIYPIIHCDASFNKILTAGDSVTIKLKLRTIRNTSFELEYEVLSNNQELAVIVSTIHITIDKKTNHKAEIPNHLRKLLENLKEGEYES